MDFPLLEKQSIVLLMPIPRSEILGKSLLFLHIHKEEAARPKGNKEIFEDFLIFSWMIKKMVAAHASLHNSRDTPNAAERRKSQNFRAAFWPR
jgi:hypothetical protein